MFHFNTESSRKVQNYSLTSKTPKHSMGTKLDLNLSKRLDKLLNSPNDQDDYYQIYSDASNTTISTICLNSDESRYTDSCWSESDATRRDDRVIELAESAFYNTKVNPFPLLNFPPTSSTKKNVSNIVEDAQNTPADATNDIMIDVRNNEESPPAVEVVNTDDAAGTRKERIGTLSNEDVVLDDGVANVVADVEDNKDVASGVGVEIESKVTDAQNNEYLTAANEIDNQTNEDLSAVDKVSNEKNDDLTSADGNATKGTEVKDDQSNEALACGIGNHSVDDRNKDLEDADVAISEIDGQNSKEDFITTEDVKEGHNEQDMTQPVVDVTNGVKDQQHNVDLADGNCNTNDIDDQIQNQSLVTNVNTTEIQFNQVNLMENVALHDVAKSLESKNLDRKNSVTSRRSDNESPKLNRNSSKVAVEVKRTAAEPSPVVSTSTRDNSTFGPRKKRYRKTVDNNHRKNVEHQLSKSSGCTKVTSTTTVRVTTNDDLIFDALADMPDLINSSVVDLASSYIDERVRSRKNQRTRCIDFGSAFPSSSSSLAPSWRNERLSSVYDEYISPREAYKKLNSLLSDGTNENLKAVMYDEYNGIRIDDEIASSEDEFLSDVEDLNVTSANWTPPESELRRQVTIILKKIHPLEDNYCAIIDDMLSKYLNYIHSKQRLAKINRIVDCVNQPISQQEKTESLIRREFDDKKLNREFYHSSIEPPDFTELGDRRRQAIIKKYTRCHNDRTFCYSYFKRSIDDRPVSKLGWRIAKLKLKMELIFA